MTARIARPAAGPQGVQVIARAAEILRVLKNADGGLSLGKIADQVGLPRSTVQRIVNALIAERFVIATSSEGGLRLGPEIQSLAAAGRIDMVETARPVLVEISVQTGETVDLAVLRGDHMVFVDQVVGSHRLRTVSAVGESFPLATTANGKSALAELSVEDAATLIARELTASGSGETVSAVIAEVEEARATGIAWDRDQHTDGISAVGTAFRDPTGMIYAVSIPVPSHRFAARKDDLVTALRDGARKIMALIGAD